MMRSTPRFSGLSLCRESTCASTVRHAGLLCRTLQAGSTSMAAASQCHTAVYRLRARAFPRCDARAFRAGTHLVPPRLWAFWFGQTFDAQERLSWARTQARAGVVVELITARNLLNYTTPGSAPHAALRELLDEHRRCGSETRGGIAPTTPLGHTAQHARCCYRMGNHSAVISWAELRGVDESPYTLSYPLLEPASHAGPAKPRRAALNAAAQKRLLESILAARAEGVQDAKQHGQHGSAAKGRTGGSGPQKKAEKLAEKSGGGIAAATVLWVVLLVTGLALVACAALAHCGLIPECFVPAFYTLLTE